MDLAGVFNKAAFFACTSVLAALTRPNQIGSFRALQPTRPGKHPPGIGRRVFPGRLH